MVENCDAAGVSITQGGVTQGNVWADCVTVRPIIVIG